MAKTSQFFSVDLGANSDLEMVRQKILNHFPEVKVLAIFRHHQKLKRGCLKGNQFEIVVRGCGGESDYAMALKIKAEIEKKGLPNFYGEQRFGNKRDNHILGEQILRGEIKVKNKHRKKVYLEAYQSYLFNLWLAYRLQKAPHDQFLAGDYVEQEERTRPSLVTQENRASFDLQKFYLVGRLYTKGQLKSLTEIDHDFFACNQIQIESLSQLDLLGGARPAVIFPENFEILDRSDSLLFKFFLPKGSYATNLISHFFEKYD